VNLTVNLKQFTFLYQMNTGWAVWKKCDQFQFVYETFSVSQSRSIQERPLLGWAVCNAQEMLWRRWWSCNWRSTLAIHPVPHMLHKLSNWRQITQLKKRYLTEYCGRKTPNWHGRQRHYSNHPLHSGDPGFKTQSRHQIS